MPKHRKWHGVTAGRAWTTRIFRVKSSFEFKHSLVSRQSGFVINIRPEGSSPDRVTVLFRPNFPRYVEMEIA
jgi:hypothetical protein